MSEDRVVSSFDHAIAETAMRYSGAVGIGEAGDSVEIDHRICVVYCQDPRRKHRHLGCPSCYGKVAIRDIYANEVEPAGTRFMWLAGAFLGGWAAAWRDATVGMVRKPVGGSDGTGGGNPDRNGDNGHDRAPEMTVSLAKDCTECDL